MTRFLLSSFFFFLFANLANAQIATIDDYRKIIQTSNYDSVTLGTLSKLVAEFVRNKPKEVLAIALLVKEKGDNLNKKNLQANACHSIAQAYTSLRGYDSAKKYFRMALDANAFTKDNELRGIIKHDIGYSYYQQSIFDSSLIYYHQSLELKKLYSKPKQRATTLNGIGLVYRMRNNISAAATYYHEALAIYQAENDKAALNVMLNIATLYNLQKKYDSATTLFKYIYTIAQSSNDVAMMLNAQVNIALGLNYQQKFAEALPIFEELAKNTRVRQVEDIHNAVQYGLGQSYMGVKDYANAIPILKSCLKMRFRNTKFQSLAAITHLLYVAEKEQKNYSAALAYYEQLKEYNDSLLNINRSALIEELDAKYKVAQKEQQIALLDKENKVKDLQLKQEHQTLLLAQSQNKQRKQEIDLLNQQNELSELMLQKNEQSLVLAETKNEKNKQQLALLNKENEYKTLSIQANKRTIWLYTLGLALITIVAGSVFLLYRNKEKHNHKLEEKNAIISKSLNEKEILLKEIHHRVKNNLQVVSSLLNLQSRNISDTKALAAIKEGRDRVKSMALIHQNLYNDENLTGVDVKDYIEKLTQSLFASYNIQEGKVLLETDIDQMNLDVDTVIPLGLILTELISNALKYAFDETQQNGNLQVQLKQEKGNLLLRVKDNGKGLPDNWSYESTNSLGYQLIKSFAAKMKAMLTVTGNNGTDIQMIITRYKLNT
jgi:two-component sensor histidine kinase